MAASPGVADYPQLQERIRSTVEAVVPPGSTVLVVSRGDTELLRLDGRTGWHFPRDDKGNYPGYYPRDSVAAIAHLEQLRSKGADHILFPSTSLWWLEHYPELAQHLESRYTSLVREDDVCRIYALRRAEAPRLRRFLDSLLPQDASVLVLSSGDAQYLDTGRESAHFPQGPGGAYAGYAFPDNAAALDHLEELRERGAEFLVIPAARPSWLDEYPGFETDVERRHRRIARREHLCTVVELFAPAARSGSPGAARRPAEASEAIRGPASDGAQPPGRERPGVGPRRSGTRAGLQTVLEKIARALPRPGRRR
jgi:hypothetical protein